MEAPGSVPVFSLLTGRYTKPLTILLEFFFFFNVNSTETFHFAGRKETVLFSYILEELDFDKFTLLFSCRFQVNYFSVAA